MAGEKVEIKDAEDLERWLEGREKRDAVIIAARTALRAVPALVHDPRSALIVPSLRAMAAPWVAATCSTHGAEDSLRSAALSASRSALSAADSASRSAALSAARSARSAADSAADSARSARSAADSTTYSTTYSAAYSAAYSALSASYASVEADALVLVDGLFWKPNGQAVLWLAPPYRDFDQLWSKLKSDLLAREGENWQVWTDWYEARLRRDPVNCELELARVLEPTEEDWADPVRANARLAEIEARFAKRTRGTAPYVFGLGNERLEASSLRGEASQDQIADAMQARLLEQAQRYLDAMSASNAPSRVCETARTITDLLANWREDPFVVELWMASNDLGGDRDEFDVPARRDELPDDAIAKMEALRRSLEGLLGLYPEVRTINAGIAASKLSLDDTRSFEVAAGEVGNRLRDDPKHVAPGAVEALDHDKKEVDEALERATSAFDPAEAAKAAAQAAEKSAARQLTHGDMLHVLTDDVAAAAPEIEAKVREAVGDEAVDSVRPRSMAEFSAEHLRELQAWSVRNQNVLIDSGVGIAVVLIAVNLGPLGFLVTLPYLKKYAPILAPVARLLEAWSKAKKPPE